MYRALHSTWFFASQRTPKIGPSKERKVYLDG